MLVQAAMLLHAAYGDFVVVDEAAHLASGLAHWKTGDFRPYDVNPPLPRLVGTLPILALDPDVLGTTSSEAPYDRPEWTLANPFALTNADQYMVLVRVGRWFSVALTVATTCLLWTWSRELHGTVGGLISVSLWVFCPLALGHGHLLTPDAAAACFGLFAHRAFSRYVQAPDWLNAICRRGRLWRGSSEQVHIAGFRSAVAGPVSSSDHSEDRVHTTCPTHGVRVCGQSGSDSPGLRLHAAGSRN
jgi:hypothetical protein